MPLSIPCDSCGNEIPQSSETCPHCGRPGIYWNVFAAQEPAELAELTARYQRAKDEATARGAAAVFTDFERALGNSRAVIARPENEVLRLASSTRQLYATYYQLIEAGVRLPDGDEWDILRELADVVLFSKYKDSIRFATLSLDGIGLSNYGSCSVVLKEEMIAHRTSVLEENSALFVERHGIRISKAPNVPKGRRATWASRAKLCVTKLSKKLTATTRPDDYSGILLKQGASSNDDEFVEAHIFGPITVRSIERVIITEVDPDKKSVIRRAIEAKLQIHNVPVSR
jgi:hypothetical protein